MENIFLAFDFGIKNIGVAVGQKVTKSAYPLSTLTVKDNILTWKLIKNLFQEWKPDVIIVGLPLNMDGTDQLISCITRKFSKKLYRLFNKNVILHDERLSTLEARSRLFESGGFRALKKRKIDSISAVIILESYFHSKY